MILNLKKWPPGDISVPSLGGETKGNWQHEVQSSVLLQASQARLWRLRPSLSLPPPQEAHRALTVLPGKLPEWAGREEGGEEAACFKLLFTQHQEN